MGDFELEALKELYRQERKKLEELGYKEIEKELCEIALELLKSIERDKINPGLTQVVEEKYREFFERRKKAKLTGLEKYNVQKSFLSMIEKRLDDCCKLIPGTDPQGDIIFKENRGD